MMHTPRTTLMFRPAKAGAGFAPVPGLGAGICLHAGDTGEPGSLGTGIGGVTAGRGQESRTIDALRDALADSDSSVRAAAVHSISLRNDPALKKRTGTRY